MLRTARGRRFGFLLLVALLLALATAPAPAVESEPAAELGLTVAAGFGERAVPGTWIPVEVALQPARLLAGTLEVSGRSEGGRSSQTRDVEVTAGSRKVFRFLARSGSVGVRFHEEGKDPVSLRVPLRAATGTWLTGVLGTLPADLPVLRNEPTGASGTWVEVDPAWVELSPWALEPLGGLVADRAVVEDLSDTGRRNLAVAVASGLDLIVVADVAGVVDTGLPWQPATAAAPIRLGVGGELVGLEPAAAAWSLPAADVVDGAREGTVAAAVPAGLGRVVAVAAAPGVGPAGRSAELWSAVASPRVASPADGGWRVDGSPWQLGRLLQPPGGAGPPSLPWLAAFMVTYVLVVGPVNAVVLSRLRRRELAWVTVPIVTAVFTAAAFAGAVRDQPETGIAGRLAYWIDGVGVEALVVGARSATPGDHGIELAGEGWTARGLVDTEGGATIREGDGLTVEMELSALQLGGVAARRPMDASPPLDLEALAGADGLTVTVTNDSAAMVQGVRLRAAGGTRRVGDLEPGASETVVFDSAGLPAGMAHGDPFADLGASASLPSSMEAVLRGDVADGTPGLVWATGVTEDPINGVTVDGRPPYQAGSVIGVAVHPVNEPGHLNPFTVERDLVVFGQDMHQYAPQVIEGPGEAFLRFRIPPGASPTALRSDLQRGDHPDMQVELRVWDTAARSWKPRADAFGPDGQQGDPATLVGPLGEVWVRATGDLFPFDFSGRSVAGAQAGAT